MPEIILSPSQQLVVDEFPDFLLSDDTYMTISGFAGSGKTFLVKYLAEIVEHNIKLIKVLAPNVPKREIHFTATTNKAAAVLKFMLSKEVSTIHSLLGLKVINNYTTGAVKLKQDCDGKNLNNTVVFIDEASMINRQLLTAIRTAVNVYKDCKVVFIGDKYQLPPVKEDLCPVFTQAKRLYFLSEIQRQVKDSPIIKLSTKYRSMLDDIALDWPEIENVPGIIHHHTNKHTFFNAIQAAYTGDHEVNDLRVMAWANSRVHEYNNWIRGFLGKTTQFEVDDMVVTNKPLFVGRRILAQTDSILRIVEVEPSTIEKVPGYLISLAGLINEAGYHYRLFQPSDWQKANQLAKGYAQDKDWGNYFNIKENWADLRPVHASTVHKAQGSTYKTVFIDINNIGKCTRWRETVRLLYVAITRASLSVHLYGQVTTNYNKQPVEDIMKAFANLEVLS